MTIPLFRPEPRRIVDASTVERMIADADREISALESEAERMCAAADDAEARLAAVGADERASAWATIQLDRFITRLRSDVETETSAVVLEAQLRAHASVEHAQAEVAARRAHVRAHDLFAPEAPTPPTSTLSPANPWEPVVPEAVPSAPVPPESLRAVPTDATRLAPAELSLVEESPPPLDQVFGEIAPEALDDADPVAFGVSGHDEFWTSEVKTKRRFPKPNRRAVATQGLALLLVAAAALVRFV